MTTSATVTQYYNNVLQRDPSSSELSSWVALIDSGAVTAAQALDAVVTSTEAQTFAAQVVRIYQAAFGRVPDTTGINGWVDGLADGSVTTTDLASGFTLSAEWSARYGGTEVNTATLTALYQNVLGRSPSGAEVDAWIATGQTIDQILLGFANSAEFQNNISTTVNTLLTTAGNTATADIATVYDGTTSLGTGVTGETFALTTGVDNIVGTSAGDVINGFINTTTGSTDTTFSGADTIDGAGGTDSFNLTVSGANAAGALPGATITNVEQFFIRDINTSGASDYDFGTIAGETQVWNDRSTQNVDFQNVGTGAAIGLKGDGSTELGLTEFDYATAGDAVTIALDGGVQADADTDVTATAGTAESATITSTGGANEVDVVTLAGGATIESLTIAATTNLSLGAGVAGDQVAIANGAIEAGASLTVTGAGAVDLETLAANFDSVDASGNTGGVTVGLDAETDTTFTGGAGNDSVFTGAVLGTNGSANGGDGTDTLTVTDTTHLNSTTLGGRYTNFETLGVTDGVAVDLDNISGITAVEMADGAGTTQLTDMSATQAAAVTLSALTGAATFGIKNAGNVGQLDTLSVTVTDGDTTTSEAAVTTQGDLTVADVETINFTLVDDLELATVANMNEFTSLTISGAGDAGIYTDGTGVVLNASMDASSSTGTVKLSAAEATGNGMALTGGAGNDQLIGSAQVDNITGNAGNDTLQAGASEDILSGGAGNDVIDGGAGNDTMTGGDGTDNFVVDVNGLTTVDVITDMVLGTDNFVVNAAPGSVTGTVTAATGASLAAAAANAGTTIGANTAGIFTYDGSSYLLINDGTAGTIAATDTIVNITGYTGTLSADDFVTTGVTLTTTANGTETVTGTVAADTITGGTGDDTITGGAGADTIDGGTGSDDIVYSADSDAGTAGTLAEAQGDTVTFVVADDEISLIGDFLTGELTGTAADAVNLIANAGGVDLDDGGTGNDTVQLIAGDAANTAAKADLFDLADLNAAIGTISNGTAGDERILAFTSVDGNTVVYKYTDDGNDAAIEAAELQVLGTFNVALTAADFTFA
ncbi:uncharacterized protein DUF4214 [Roseibium hamelinense]|uniref:Uncharacterized protein DUF4214 n=1 Tax=Roseibium hamelinense TaxID=150831 RepID=A0A562T1I8_9HYPH|nr:DUF4214 domain-containing protein [Roseibium hamelinense]TWI87412.1 uncharacterized protein DUF4214 [Roseibium hamelinense]